MNVLLIGGSGSLINSLIIKFKKLNIQNFPPPPPWFLPEEDVCELGEE